MEPVAVSRGEGCLVLAMPHTGSFVPPEAWVRLNARGRALADTDWHLDRLYAGLAPDAAVVSANFHRCVIDANRDPSGESLYPGQNTARPLPADRFRGPADLRAGARAEPPAEIRAAPCNLSRTLRAALARELERVQAAARRRGALRLPLHPLAPAVPVRGQAAPQIQCRHEQWRDLRAGDGGRRGEALAEIRRLLLRC